MPRIKWPKWLEDFQSEADENHRIKKIKQVIKERLKRDKKTKVSL